MFPMLRRSPLPLAFLLITSLTACSTATPHTATPTASNTSRTTPNSTPSIAPNSTPAAALGSATSRATPAFDYFLLNLSWSPEYCATHSTAAECANHSTFVLHGLWAEDTNGSYPENCSNAPGPADPSQYADIYPDPGLLQHEWQTHGTCSGLGPDAFFTAARTAFHSVTIPPTLNALTTQTSLTPDQILSLFTASNPGIPRSSLVVSCGNNFLTAVEVCLDKNLHPTACGTLKSCKANSVRIPPP